MRLSCRSSSVVSLLRAVVRFPDRSKRRYVPPGPSRHSRSRRGMLQAVEPDAGACGPTRILSARALCFPRESPDSDALPLEARRSRILPRWIEDCVTLERGLALRRPPPSYMSGDLQERCQRRATTNQRVTGAEGGKKIEAVSKRAKRCWNYFRCETRCALCSNPRHRVNISLLRTALLKAVG